MGDRDDPHQWRNDNAGDARIPHHIMMVKKSGSRLGTLGTMRELYREALHQFVRVMVFLIPYLISESDQILKLDQTYTPKLSPNSRLNVEH